MLLVDADPQGQVALGLGFPKKVRVTLKNMLENIIMGLEFDPKEVILKHKEGVEVIPANKLLAGLDVALINVEDREKVLKEYLELLEDDYDYILIDCIYFYIELLFSIENSHMDRKRKEKAEIEQKQLKKEIANSQKNVEWYTRRLADTYKEKTEGKIQMEDYIKKQTEYRACKEAAQEKIKELSDKYEIYKMQLLGNPDYFAVYETFLKTEELNKMLIDVLVKKITVAENAKIEITFQFEDEMRMLYERLKESCSA